eukprot:g6962.t1
MQHPQPPEQERTDRLAELLKRRAEAAKTLLKEVKPLDGYLRFDGKVVNPRSVGMQRDRWEIVVLDLQYLRSFFRPSLEEVLRGSEIVPLDTAYCDCCRSGKLPGVLICPKRGTHFVWRELVHRFVLAELALIRFFKPSFPQPRVLVTNLEQHKFCSVCAKKFEPRKAKLLTFPEELISRITDYLPMRDVFRLSMTCKTLRSDLRGPWVEVFERQKAADATELRRLLDKFKEKDPAVESPAASSTD